MADEQLTAGDIVQLKSGGPDMTIEKVGKSGSGSILAWCDWFYMDSGAWKKDSGTFPPSSLKPVKLQ